MGVDNGLVLKLNALLLILKENMKFVISENIGD